MSSFAIILASAGILYFALLLGAYQLQTVRPSGQAHALSLCILIGLSLLAAINLELGLIPQKVASTRAFEVYQAGFLSDSGGTFIVHALLTVPAFLVSNSWLSTIGTNIAIVAALFVFARDRSRLATYLIVAPAVINLAIFALRDVLIGAILFILVRRQIEKPGSLRPLEFIGMAALAITRPESALVVAGAFALTKVRGMKKSSTLRPMAFVALGAAGFILALLIPRALGTSVSLNSIGQLPSFLESFFESRSTRNFDAAAETSNILGGALSSWPLPARLPVQIVAFFVLPLPFEIRNLTLALAFVDSIVFIVAWRRVWPSARSFERTLLASYVLSVSFFASNYGNLLRLRMPVYFILAAIAISGAGAARRRRAALLQDQPAGSSPARCLAEATS